MENMIVERSFIIMLKQYIISILAGFCWIAALTNLLLSLSANYSPASENTVPAYYSTQNYRLSPVSQDTYELFLSDVPCSDIFSECSKLLQDTSLQCLYSHKEPAYKDYYFYSPELEKMDIPSSPHGYNLHVAVTKSGHIYLGFPEISYDF